MQIFFILDNNLFAQRGDHHQPWHYINGCGKFTDYFQQQALFMQQQAKENMVQQKIIDNSWLKDELQNEQAELEQINKFFKMERFAALKRPYTAKDVAALRNSYPLQQQQAFKTDKKLFQLLSLLSKEHKYTHTFGALDPVQVVQMAKYLKSIYVSGWQSSSTASTTNEPGPGNKTIIFYTC